jgi:hypothetical protein
VGNAFQFRYRRVRFLIDDSFQPPLSDMRYP